MNMLIFFFFQTSGKIEPLAQTTKQQCTRGNKGDGH